MAGRKKKAEGKGRDASRIMFLSLNMILLAFFILLVALSNTNETKEAELAVEVRKAFQSFGGAYLGLGKVLEERGVDREKSLEESTREVERFLGELSRFIQENEEAQSLSYKVTSEGLTVHLYEAFTFAEGSDRLLGEFSGVLDTLYDMILRTTNPVRIEGHTDNRDIRSNRLLDQWELSGARAMAVYRFFTRSGEIPSSRFTVAGYGGSRPVASNVTAEGRAKNRRVTVTLVGRVQRAGGP